ncbi:MAG: ABC transporter permease [Candidatus Andersenbacteria bacterium]
MRFTLVKELAVTDFKLRYKNSVLGYFWSLLKPLAIFGSLYLVFSVFARFQVEHYQLYLLLGIMLWNYFTEASINGMHALVNKSTLLTKINVNKATIILASNVTTLLTLALNLVIFFVFVVIFNPTLSWTYLMLPLSIAEIFLVGLGISYILGVFYVKLRDLVSIWEIVLQIGFWVTPIIYPITIVPKRFLPIVLLNPVYRIISEARGSLIEHVWPSAADLVTTLSIALLIFLVGYLVYTRRAPYVNEDL